MRIQWLLKNTQFRNGIGLLELVQKTNSNTYYTEGFRDCSQLSVSKRTGEEFNQCVHKGWENKKLFYMTVAWWTNCLKKQEIIHIGVSGKCVRMGFVSYITATSCQDKPHHNASPQVRRNNTCVQYRGTLSTILLQTVLCRVILISGCRRMYESVCGLPRCIWRTCAAFSEDNLQNKNTTTLCWQQAPESSISLSTWADALCWGLSWCDAAVTQQGMKGMSHNSVVNEAAPHWMLQLIMCLLWHGTKEGLCLGKKCQREMKEKLLSKMSIP